MARVQKLPPINEEGDGGGGGPLATPRRRQLASIHRLPKDVFTGTDDDDGERFFTRRSPMKNVPIVPVQPVRRVKTPPTPPEPKKPQKELFKMQMTNHLSPKDVNHTLIDGLVADYLHYSRYGHVIPVYEGTSATSCPCCTDRNRQNVRSLLGFPKNVTDTTPAHAPTRYDRRTNVPALAPTKYDAKSRLYEEEGELKGDATLYPNSLYALERRRKVKQKEPTQEEQRLQRLAAESHRKPWMTYQPLPYATNYLNPEFNRPSVVNAQESGRPGGYTAMRHQVLEADSNYDAAMARLGGYTRYS